MIGLLRNSTKIQNSLRRSFSSCSENDNFFSTTFKVNLFTIFTTLMLSTKINDSTYMSFK